MHDMNLTIGRVVDEEELSTVREMFREYVASIDLDLEFQGFSAELAELPGKYTPPSGCILLAKVDGRSAGCVALRPLGEGVCEVKRLFVRPEYRGLKLGRKLGEKIVQEARDLGYGLLRLDTLSSRMGAAVSLYRALGFREIPAYCDSPFDDAVFMELTLD
jgi:putative acetyltransferase